MAPLQKRALYSLVAGLALTVFFVAVLMAQGDITAFDHNLNVRLVVYAAMVGVPLSYLILVNVTLRKPTDLDERDRVIIVRSARVQYLAIVFSLAAWTIALTEVYRDSGSIPVAYINLIFVSILIIGMLAQSAGILFVYRMMDRNG